MENEEKKSTNYTKSKSLKNSNTDESIVKETKKSQKVKVLVSVYRYGDKIVSAHGIPDRNYILVHRLDKNKLKPEELFHISSVISNDNNFRKNNLDYKDSLSYILDDKQDFILLPRRPATEYLDIGNLRHEILNIEIELFTK